MIEQLQALNDIKNLPVALPITEYPNDKLKEVSKPVLSVISTDNSLQELLDAMETTLEAYDALGLSAIQVGIPLKVFLARTPEGVIKVINPTMTVSGESVYDREGCLSVPGLYPKVLRSEKCTLEYFDERGEKQTYDAEGYWARIIQHEMSHLMGKTFFDEMDKLSRERELRHLKLLRRKMK